MRFWDGFVKDSIALPEDAAMTLLFPPERGYVRRSHRVESFLLPVDKRFEWSLPHCANVVLGVKIDSDCTLRAPSLSICNYKIGCFVPQDKVGCSWVLHLVAPLPLFLLQYGDTFVVQLEQASLVASAMRALRTNHQTRLEEAGQLLSWLAPPVANITVRIVGLQVGSIYYDNVRPWFHRRLSDLGKNVRIAEGFCVPSIDPDSDEDESLKDWTEFKFHNERGIAN